ncbi:MAG: hypothetical protein EBZ46_04865 [Actinobacteria bacterium]|nr:hypothetical protein [Actinomycetota bacterium]
MKTVVDPTRTAVENALGDVRTVVTIGAYDGVHLGHRAVIAQVRERAKALGATSVVVTFDRHPASVVRPESAPKLLTDPAQKLELLASTGIDATMVVPFGVAESHEAPSDFVQRVLVGALKMREVIVGEDFHFGYKRGGNVALYDRIAVDTLYFTVHHVAMHSDLPWRTFDFPALACNLVQSTAIDLECRHHRRNLRDLTHKES